MDLSDYLLAATGWLMICLSFLHGIYLVYVRLSIGMQGVGKRPIVTLTLIYVGLVLLIVAGCQG